MEITDIKLLDLNKSYSYFDYLSWKFAERVELFKGKIMPMSPAPASRHQRILGKLGTRIHVFLTNNPCEVFFAPFDVRLKKEKNDKLVTTVVQPDICVVCDTNKIDEKGCNGAPDLVIEILSPGNSNKEMKNKFELYQEAGVLEYLIVDPEREIILQYILKDGSFINHRPLVIDDELELEVLKGFKVNISSLF